MKKNKSHEKDKKIKYLKKEQKRNENPSVVLLQHQVLRIREIYYKLIITLWLKHIETNTIKKNKKKL